MILPVILSGGSGTRLWPVSREEHPKQFLKLNSSQSSLLQETVQRLEGMQDVLSPLLVCNEHHRFLVGEQLQALGVRASGLLLEPCARNTAPAVALAALAADDIASQPLLLVMPADHVIRDPEAFRLAVEQGRELAQRGKLVAFGITPSHPHTGYGYIRRGEALHPGYRVDAFVEKPDLAIAEAYLASGDYLWNSGIFLFSAERYLSELKHHAEDILTACKAAYAARHQDLDFLRVDEKAFADCRSESIDYAVMEPTRQAAVIPMEPGWSDIGAWDAVHALGADHSAEGNATRGDVMLRGVRNSLVFSDARLVAAIGVQDLVIVETADAVLVTTHEYAQDTKQIVAELKASRRSEGTAHPTTYRPWGHYHSLIKLPGYQVKEIVVKPGAQLSLQMHHHRAEHWVVVHGSARVTQGTAHGCLDSLETFLLKEGESTFIPLGTVHRLDNPGDTLLKLIEVQTGDYLGEDDIIRFDDVYGRCITP